MPLPLNRENGEALVRMNTTSIGATPVAAITAAPRRGYVRHLLAFSEGASTGTITCTVSVRGTSIGTGGCIFAGGTSAFGTGNFGYSPSTYVDEGDLITVTPSGGGGASIPGHFFVTVRGS